MLNKKRNSSAEVKSGETIKENNVSAKEVSIENKDKTNHFANTTLDLNESLEKEQNLKNNASRAEQITESIELTESECPLKHKSKINKII